MTFLDNHRGPFRFCVTRPHRTRKGFFLSDWLKGTVEREDVESEADALLKDPRDTIRSVHVWSESEGAFIGGYALKTIEHIVLEGVKYAKPSRARA